ncbi:hypothetical protein AMRN_2115 [Malaciobacter marinus]|uniref:Uncharacterized protein n=2 Tax=Malaciobacter marinus TaxID=505249 RepID=A0A347TMK2_9BACT|nr:hypothetical protein [Malaciobacter marinus]AXX87830.1 hypothetical protein AMRN_2115 [Malaciobacter marinus]
MEKFSILNNYFFTILIHVNEQIDDKYIKEFICSNLQLKNISYKHKYIYYSYVEQLNSYQVFVFEKNDFVLLFLDNINGDGLYTLLFYDSYLILLKNKKLYYFLNLKYKLSENEIIQLIKNKLNIEISTIMNLDNKSFEKLIGKSQKNKYNIIDFSSNNYLYAFMLNCIFCMIFLSNYYFYTQNKTKDSEKNKVLLTKEKKDLKTKKLIDILNNSFTYNLKFKNLVIKENKIDLLVTSNKVVNIENFSKKIGAKVNFLEHNKQSNKYEAKLFIQENR